MLAPTTNSTTVKVPARHLQPGDVTGSNEIVLSIGAGSRTPRGKVEVVLQKGERKRCALWNAGTVISIRRAIPIPSADIPLSDRLPTFHELATFDAGKAWDRLSPEQQREIGILALQFGTVGQCEGYFHDTLEGVRNGFVSSHWTAQVQATAVWPRLQVELIESAAQIAFQELCDHFDPLWPQLFNWQARKEVKQS